MCSHVDLLILNVKISFAEESIMNEVCNISASTFYKHLQTALSLLSKVELTAIESSKRFGIRRHQKVDIRHVLSIVIYTAETRYCHALNRSFWAESGSDAHSQNFYWFGRFLFEAVEYFGDCFNERLDGDTAKILQGASRTFTFDNFAPSVHYPRSTTSSIKVALQFSSKDSCVLELIPKYSGTLNTSKYIDVSGMSQYEDEQEKYVNILSLKYLHILTLKLLALKSERLAKHLELPHGQNNRCIWCEPPP